MSLDNIRAVEAEKQAKADEKVSRNSIPFKQESFSRATEKAKLIAKRDIAMEIVSEAIAQDVERGRSRKRVLDKHFDYAAKIIAMDDNIELLDKPEATEGPTEYIGNRAIRLIDRMYKAAEEKSKAIYSGEEKVEETVTETEVVAEVPTEVKTEVVIEAPVEAKTEVITIPPVAPVIPVPPVETVPVVDVEKISTEAKETVDESIKNAISEEESINNSNIKSIIDEAFETQSAGSSVEEETNDIEFDREEIEKIINEKLAAFVNEEEKVHDYEKDGPMTDEEIVASQDKLAEADAISEEARHQRILEEEAKKEKEVAEINAAKGYDFGNLPKISVEAEIPSEQVRDDPVIVEDREIESEEKVEEYISVEEPRSVVMTSEEKSKVHELMEKVREAREQREKLKLEDSGVDENIKTLKNINDLAVESETAVKKKSEELAEEANKAKEDYAKAVEAMEKELAALNSENEAMVSDIQSKKEIIVTIQESTERKDREIESISKENKAKEEEIAKYRQLKAMLDGDTALLSDENQKIR